MKYKFICTDYNDNVLTQETSQVALSDLIQQFRLFLLGAGFSAAGVDEYIEPN